MLANILQLPDCVVGEVAHRARGERRQPRHDRGTMLAQQFLYHLNRAALTLFFLFAALYHNVSSFSPNLHVGARSQEGVAADLLATLHRLEQEGVRFIARNREESGNRRQQVSHNRLHYRHQRGLSGQAAKLFVVRA